MDLRTVVTISALFLMTAGANSTVILSDNQSNVTGKGCNCSSSAPSPTAPSTSSPSSFAPVLGLLTIRWWSKCEGEVNLIPYRLSDSSSPVCHKSETTIKSLLRNVCENREGCKNTLGLIRGRNTHGYFITERGAEEMSSCNTLRVQCSVVVLPDVQGELRTYKVVTAVLCCVLLVLLLIRFTRPTVNALQKRLSDRRQNRWIGPTQSHSVSYHRGKTAVKNNDGEKRMSFPALERLTVSDSREPSSNRNSDYNF